MNVKLLQQRKIGHKLFQAGEVVVVTPQMGTHLIGRNQAEATKSTPKSTAGESEGSIIKRKNEAAKAKAAKKAKKKKA